MGLPDRDEVVRRGVQRVLRRRPRVSGVSAGDLVDPRAQARALQPCIGACVLVIGEGVEAMAGDLGDPRALETSHERQVAGLVGRDFRARHAEDEGLVALVAGAVKQVGGLRIGAGHDQAGHAHDVELKARGVEALDLLVARHQHLAALVSALLGARLLVLDVIAGHARLDEAPDEIADMGVTAVPGVGIGDDQRPEVDLRRGLALVLGHTCAGEALVAIGGEQGPDNAGGLVGNLREGVARQVRSGVLGGRALGRGGPSAQVEGLDPGPPHRHRVARGVGPEGGDRSPVPRTARAGGHAAGPPRCARPGSPSRSRRAARRPGAGSRGARSRQSARRPSSGGSARSRGPRTPLSVPRPR